MNHRKTAEELREHAAVAVANVRTDIHSAFKHAAGQGFSREHVHEVLLRKGYRQNDLQYVEQLLDGTQPNPKDPQRRVAMRISPSLYVTITIMLVLLLGFGVLWAITTKTQAESDARMVQQAKLTEAHAAVQKLHEQQQSLDIVADQLGAFPTLAVNLAPEDR